MQAQNALADRLAFRQRQTIWQRQNLIATSVLIVASTFATRSPEFQTLPHLIRTYPPANIDFPERGTRGRAFAVDITSERAGGTA